MRMIILGILLFAAVICTQGLADEQNEKQIDWIKKNAITFKTVEAENGFDDLVPLKELIGDARIVSLGESTHGSREIFQMKHRLVEFLASEMGFTIFSIEANMPESYRLNDYVLKGEGDPKRLIAGMYFWTWNTEEVLNMVQWMRDFNEMKKGHIEFTGFDMQTQDVAAKIVLDFLAEHDVDSFEVAKEAYAKTKRATLSARNSFASATGSFPVEVAIGKRVKFSGWIKTEDVDQFAGLWWRADGSDRETLAFNNMRDIGPRRTQDWAPFSFELDIPMETDKIFFGVLMSGKGKAWFDGLKVTLDGEIYENKNLFDFDFEAEALKGLKLRRSTGYRGRLDKEHAKVGKQSLRLESREINLPIDALPASEGLKAATSVLDELQKSRDELAKKIDEEQVAWVIQNARIVEQCMESLTEQSGVNVRDRSMAENVAWILQHNPKAKIVLWAHNFHVSKQDQAMGKHLDERFGDEHLAIAFATTKGEYQAISSGKGLTDNMLASPPAGSAEDVFHRTGLPRFVLDLRNVKSDSEESGWLAKPILFRSIGAMAMENQFHQQNLSELYDAVIYIEETSRAKPISQ